MDLCNKSMTLRVQHKQKLQIGKPLGKEFFLRKQLTEKSARRSDQFGLMREKSVFREN